MKFFIIAIFITNLFGGIYDNLAKNSLKFIKPNIIESIGKNMEMMELLHLKDYQ